MRRVGNSRQIRRVDKAQRAMRRENAKSYLRRMGRAKRNPSPSAPALMGIASLHPSYRPQAGLPRFARNDTLKANRTQPTTTRGNPHAHASSPQRLPFAAHSVAAGGAGYAL